MKLHSISIAALFLAVFGLAALPNSAQAQQQTGQQQEDPASFESLSSALNDAQTNTQALGQTDAQNVRVINVEEITSALEEAQIQRLRTAYENANTDELESAVENSEALKNALKENSTMGGNTNAEVDASDVVAVDVREGGQTIVYVDPNGELEGDNTGDF